MRHQDFLLEVQQGIQYLAMMVGGSRKNNGGSAGPRHSLSELPQRRL